MCDLWAAETCCSIASRGKGSQTTPLHVTPSEKPSLTTVLKWLQPPLPQLSLVCRLSSSNYSLQHIKCVHVQVYLHLLTMHPGAPRQGPAQAQQGGCSGFAE